MQICILGEQVTFSAAQEAYNTYRLEFQKAADRAQDTFKSLYQTNSSLDDVINKVPEQVEQCLNPIFEMCIRILMEHGVLYVDKAQFAEQYSAVQDIWAEPYLKVYDKYAEIVLEQKDMDAYRTARRKYRSRWRGGGFGLSGALQGAATAGALNLITGAGHMLFNGVGKVFSSISANMQKNTIFRTPDTYNSIADGLWDSAFELHIALIDCLKQTGADELPQAGAVSGQDIQAAQALLNNVRIMDNISQRRSALLQSFCLNPYQEDWYRTALELFGDEDGSLGDAERIFGISVIAEEKAARLEKLAQELPRDTEEHALESANKIEQEKQRLHFYGETPQTQLVLDAVKNFDRQYRTVDGIELQSREEADYARTELEEIKAIEEQIDYTSLPSIAIGQKKLQVYTSLVAKRHQKELRKAWENLDLKLRTIDTLLPSGKKILCKTQEAANKLRPIVNELYQNLKACGEGPNSEAALHNLKRHIETGGYPTALSGCYINEIDRRLANIDLTLRTTMGKTYPTREQAREADRIYAQIKERFVSGNPRKEGYKLRAQIERADLPEEIKHELCTELFQLENAREIKTAKTFSTITAAILLVLVVGGYFFQLSGTEEFAQKDVRVLGVSLMVTDVEIDTELTFLDGLKNGVLVFSRCIGDLFVNGFWEYIGGFQDSHGILFNGVWAIIGIFWVTIKQVIVVIPRYFVSVVMTLMQTASFTYYIGYAIGVVLPIAVSQFNFDEDNQEENVKRIKEWTPQKIILTIGVVLFVTVVSVILVQNGG